MVRIDGSDALARIGFDQDSRTLFLEYRPSPRSSDYALLIKLTRRHIDGFQSHGPDLVLTPMAFTLEQGKQVDSAQAYSNAGIWDR